MNLEIAGSPFLIGDNRIKRPGVVATIANPSVPEQSARNF
jgi:hypothetical protein